MYREQARQRKIRYPQYFYFLRTLAFLKSCRLWFLRFFFLCVGILLLYPGMWYVCVENSYLIWRDHDSVWNKRVFLSFTSWTLVAVAMVFALIAAVRYRVAKYKRRAVEEAFNFYMDEGCQNTREHEDVTKVLRELEMLKF